MQEELLGLAELENSAALARQVDASVLFREGETSRVTPFACMIHQCWPVLRDLAIITHWDLTCLPVQGAPTCTPRAVIFDLSGSLGGELLHARNLYIFSSRPCSHACARRCMVSTCRNVWQVPAAAAAAMVREAAMCRQ